MTQLYTASWSALYAASKAGRLEVLPVRISRGGPRFWPAAKSFPALGDLMPEGWMLGIKHADRFFAAYREKLDRTGVEAITRQLDALYGRAGEPLALACFEPFGGPPCHRHEFSRWYEAKTEIPEWGARPENWAKTTWPKHLNKTGGSGQLRLDVNDQLGGLR